VFYLALPGCEFEVLEPPEVVQAVGSLAERLRRAAAARADVEGPNTPRN
jgi:hypothetical protein